MSVSFSQPWVLYLLPLSLLPLGVSLFLQKTVVWNALVPSNKTSSILERLIKFIGLVALVNLILGMAGIYQTEKKIEQVGTGAHVVFVLDRSASMNETFGGKVPDEQTPAKSQVARELLSQFVDQRPHDLFGVVGFSTQPFYMSPLSEHKSATQAAIIV